MSDTIKIEGIGPVIERLEIPVPEQGGILVLRASNGRGKSEALKAVEALAKGKGSLTVSDRRATGEVQGPGGARLTVRKSTRHVGRLEVAQLADDLSLDEIVNPGLKDVAKRDAKRIQLLARLLGCQLGVNDFSSLLPQGKDQLLELVHASAWKESDPVQVAKAVKKDLHEAARKAESHASEAQGRAQAYRQQVEGVDLEEECDADVLSERLEEAIREHSAANARMDQAHEARRQAENAQEKLQELNLSQHGAEVENLQEEVTAGEQALEAARSEVDQLRKKLEAAEAKVGSLEHDQQQKQRELETAQRHAQEREQLQELIGAGREVDVTSAEQACADAFEAVERAREAGERGMKVRAAREARERCEYEQAQADQASERAEALRSAAKATDSVLTEALKRSGVENLWEADGRLLTHTPSRGETYLDELSQGELWRRVLELALPRIGEHGLLVLKQEAWEGLDADGRRIVAEVARERKLTVLTAEASREKFDDPLHVEEYQPVGE